MAPPNDPVIPSSKILKPKTSEKLFQLSEDGKLMVKGLPLLSEIPTNVTFTEYSSLCKPSDSDAPLSLIRYVESNSYKGGFLSFNVDEPSDRIMNSLGKFTDRNFLSIFRFKTWWSTQWVGTNGSDLQMETQWVLLDVPELASYALIMPLIEGPFRSALHSGENGHIMICAESGSTQVKSSSFKAIAYVHVSDNPYNIMKEAYSAVRVHLNTFRLLEEKPTPSIMDRFGWCTWDALYLSVDPTGVWHGVSDFAKGGVPLKFLIIDDGWQSINIDGDDPNQDSKNLVIGGEQMTARLHRLDEGEKFRKYKAGSLLSSTNNSTSYDPMRPKRLIEKGVEIRDTERERRKAIESGVPMEELRTLEVKIEKLKQEMKEMFGDNDEENGSMDDEGVVECGMKALTKDLRVRFKELEDIWVWQALCGAWGGVRPGTTQLKSKIIPCKLSPGLAGTMEDAAVDKIVEGGIGLVHPDQAFEFYDSMHSHLASSGITGVKVDVIHTLEYVSEEYGGRVELPKRYYDGLTKSLKKNFNGTNLLSSMEQCNDFFFLGTKQISMGRVADDFWAKDPYGDPEGAYWLQGVHMTHCSYNSLWMGQIIHPDWDMFQSDHMCADFHAGARAICGGPIYVSDSLGCHNFDLLKKLVNPDGTIPKCQHFALPTRDVLFTSPLFDQKTILKIFNFNKYGGVIGAFNCQGAGWDRKERRFKGYKDCYKTMEGLVHVSDIEWDQKVEAMEMGNAEEYAVYLNQANTLVLMSNSSDPIKVVLNPSSFELYSFVPIKKMEGNVKFAPIGLTNMYNSGGAIQELEYKEEGCAKMKVKGGGSFLVYSSEAPNKCIVNRSEVEFKWEENKVEFDVPWVEENGGVTQVIVQFSS